MPNFEFKNDLDYSLENPLIKALKANSKAYKAQEPEYPADMLDKEKIMDNFRQQLNNEKHVFIEVPSIERRSEHATKEAERKVN